MEKLTLSRIWEAGEEQEQHQKKAIVVCAVGTSGNRKIDPDQVFELKRLLEKGKVDFAEIRNYCNDNGKEDIDHTEDFIINPGGKITESLFNAEVQSLLMFFANCSDRLAPFNKVEVLLLFPDEREEKSDSKKDPYLNALLTKFILKSARNRNRKVFYKIGEIQLESTKIGVEDKSSFKLGINHLFRILEEDRKRGKVLFFNITAGYKVWSAYLLIYALLNGFDAFYIHEEERSLIFMPKFPMQFALESLDEEISLLKYLQSLSSAEADDIRRIKDILPEWMKDLILEDKSGPEIQVSYLVENMLDIWKNRRKLFGMGRPLLEMFESEGWKSWIEKRINWEWAELWLGDQIPETVEHSRRHAKRLMEFASNLYRCMEGEMKKLGLYADKALALLIASIYLHDIGHTALTYPVGTYSSGSENSSYFPLYKFPTMIRELHHILSYELLREEKVGGNLLPDDGPEGKFIKKYVPVICAYHRGFMPLLKSSGASKVKEHIANMLDILRKRFGRKIEALLVDSQNEIAFKSFNEVVENKEEIDIALRVAALLRFIDGCDVQADRTVDDAYILARVRRVKYEADILWNEIWGRREEISEILGNDIMDLLGSFRKSADGVLSFWKGLLDPVSNAGAMDWEKEREDMEKIHKEVIKRIYACLAEKAGEADIYKMDLLSLVDKFVFKLIQYLHFIKHRVVETVLPVKNDSGRGVRILILGNKEMKKKMGEDFFSLLSGIKEDIEDEIKKVRGILDLDAVVDVKVC